MFLNLFNSLFVMAAYSPVVSFLFYFFLTSSRSLVLLCCPAPHRIRREVMQKGSRFKFVLRELRGSSLHRIPHSRYEQSTVRTLQSPPPREPVRNSTVRKSFPHHNTSVRLVQAIL